MKGADEAVRGFQSINRQLSLSLPRRRHKRCRASQLLVQIPGLQKIVNVSYSFSDQCGSDLFRSRGLGPWPLLFLFGLEPAQHVGEFLIAHGYQWLDEFPEFGINRLGFRAFAGLLVTADDLDKLRSGTKHRRSSQRGTSGRNFCF
jgi:hypothetical protein